MPSEAAEFPIVSVQSDFYLLIPSRFPTIELFERIAANRDDEVAAIENRTNPRLRAKERLSRQSPYVVDGDPPRLQNWNLAPFTYPNPEGTVLFPNSVRCLEMSGDPQTALAVSVAKRERFLGRTNEDPIGLDMRMLRRKVEGRFVDARTVTGALDGPTLRDLGDSIMGLDSGVRFDGVLFHTSERPTGTRIVVLNGDVLGRAIQCEHYRFQWNGERISRIYNFDNSIPTEQNSIDPAKLKHEENLFAA
ncbi:RES family NAD+ phosphorylase [Defluviimonas salinarum]|uniref:RES domain-containing protein n=1 Tax=Defluviimonas salinarum TaxID=2992147 RepID=A0ABT3J6Y6_9RHOB|nr:RES family NAD+ phosphorylase [Defluviimonas salinarum]MCW3783220.1 hypothetical protein [Defluviimonas salinarum]